MASHLLQSVLAPGGPQAGAIARLWFLMLGTTALVFVIVLTFLSVAVFRRRNDREGLTPAPDDSVLGAAVGIAVAATVLILFVLLVASVWTGRSVAALGAPSAVT